MSLGFDDVARRGLTGGGRVLSQFRHDRFQFGNSYFQLTDQMFLPVDLVNQLVFAEQPPFGLRHICLSVETHGVCDKFFKKTVNGYLETFDEDAANFGALQPRLQRFLDTTQPGDEGRIQLADMPIIPVHGEPRAPATLAFTGPRGDHWGHWKSRLSGKGLSQEDQRRYRSAGVTSALPDGDTSRAFFE
ncbi:MAG: hypothetical protein ACE5I7_20125 [Candidatus Binatia bacterium]